MFTIGLARGDQRIAKNLFIGIDGNAYMAYNYVYLNIFIDIYMHMISFFGIPASKQGIPARKTMSWRNQWLIQLIQPFPTSI